MGRPIIDITGNRYGNQTVLRLAPRPWRHTSAEWVVRCDCGDVRAVQSTKLRNVNTRNCRSCAASRENNGHWVYDAVGYSGAHYRIRKAKGSARNYPCQDCGKQATDWSYIGRVGYSTDIDDYEPRCPRCHKAYDREI